MDDKMIDHEKTRTSAAPLTAVLTNCIHELELLPPEQQQRVMRALKALFPETVTVQSPPQFTTQTSPRFAEWGQQAIGRSRGSR